MYISDILRHAFQPRGRANALTRPLSKPNIGPYLGANSSSPTEHCTTPNNAFGGCCKQILVDHVGLLILLSLRQTSWSACMDDQITHDADTGGMFVNVSTLCILREQAIHGLMRQAFCHSISQ